MSRLTWYSQLNGNLNTFVGATNGTASGSLAYGTGKHGQGIDGAAGQYGSFPTSEMINDPTDDFAVTCSFVPDFDMVNSLVQNKPVGHTRDEFRILSTIGAQGGAWSGSPGDFSVGLHANVSSDGSNFYVFISGDGAGEGFPEGSTTITRNNHVNFSNGDNVDVAYRWTGIGTAGIECEVYVGVNDAAPALHLTFSGQTLPQDFGAAQGVIRVANDHNNTDMWFPGVVDNVKIWKEPETTWDGLQKRRFGMNDKVAA